MKRIILTVFWAAFMAVAAVAVAAPVSAGEKKVTKKVKVGSFKGIDAAMGIKVVFTQGKATGVAQVQTTESGNEALKMKVDDGVLEIYYETRKNRRNNSIKGPTVVTLQAPELRSVELSSSASLTVTNGLSSGGSLKIDLSSSGHMTVQSVKVKNLSVDLSSSGSVALGNVRADKVNISTSSSSSLSASGIEAPKLNIESSSSSGVKIGEFSGTTLNVDASSTAKVSVKRTGATTVNLEASSLAGINMTGLKATTVNADATSNARISVAGTARNWNRDTGSGGKITVNNTTVSGKTTTGKRTPRTPSRRSSGRSGVPTQAP